MPLGCRMMRPSGIRGRTLTARIGMRVLTTLFFATLLVGCASSRHNQGPDLARAAGWQWELLPAGLFDIAATWNGAPRAETLVVYLEGDGFAYVFPNQPSNDPTPNDPIALHLALTQPGSAAIAWLARPCQYTIPDNMRNCSVIRWTSGRYSPEIIESMDVAVTTLKQRSEAHRLILVGYSGGGAIATLLAARRRDVVKLVTIVANLDLNYWTTRDGLSPLSNSLDPVMDGARLGTIPQIHFTGGKDDTVGTDVVQSYLGHLPPNTPATLKEIPNFNHACCWVRDWPLLATQAGLTETK